ncbi:unnamed protein product [Prorocentrum cordatum]|uniref:Uncharacterized protein n=1 Tax=Prorocentrum cordatum TaxID=2364126 RepID=A0ABN9YLD9_9DINO|nr:unnamed protein product [Polarella glacialis]
MVLGTSRRSQNMPLPSLRPLHKSMPDVGDHADAARLPVCDSGSTGCAEHTMEQAKWQIDRTAASAESLEEQAREARAAAAVAFSAYEERESIHEEAARGLAGRVEPRGAADVDGATQHFGGYRKAIEFDDGRTLRPQRAGRSRSHR